MIKHYLTLAFRNLTRNKFQTVFAVVGLAVAFFCFGICMYVANCFLTIDTYYDNHTRVVQINCNHKLHGVRSMAFDRLCANMGDEIEAVFRYTTETLPFSNEEWLENVYLRIIECDTTLHHIFNPRLLAGSWQAAEHMPNSFLLTESTARRLYGSPENAIGKRLDAMQARRYTEDHTKFPTYVVQAVVEDLPYNNSFAPFSSLGAWVMNDTDCKPNQEYMIYYDPCVLLREGTDIDAFCNRLEKAKIYDMESAMAHGAKMEWYLTADRTDDPISMMDKRSFYLFVAISIIPGLLILLSALSNFFHLLLSGIMMRRREYTLRRAHGAHTLDLWLMVSTQVLMILLLVGFFTLLIVELCAPLMHVTVSEDENFVLDVNEMLRQSGRHICYLLLIGLGVAWLAVARVRRDSLQESMKTSTGRRPGRHIGRNILMGWQMLVGFLFITLLGALVLQIRQNEKARFSWLDTEEKQRIVIMPYYTGYGGVTRAEIESELAAIPSVQEVSFNRGGARMLDFYSWNTSYAHTDKGDSLRVSFTVSDKSIIPFLHLTTLQGRWPERNNEAVVDARFVEQYGMGIGTVLIANSDLISSLVPNGESFTIVGVIDNLQDLSHDNNESVSPDRAGVYFFDHYWFGNVVCKCYPGQLEDMRKALADHLENRYNKNPNGPEIKNYDFPTLYDEIEKQNQTERAFLGVFWLFAGISLVITLLGIYSAITMDTTARRKEMAIRKINGAKTWQIALRFCRLYAVLMVITAAIVFPLTVVLFDWVADSYRTVFNYGFLFYLGIFLTIAAFIALTIGTQVYKIARINPAKIVKSE